MRTLHRTAGHASGLSCILLAALLPTCAAQDEAGMLLATWDASRADAFNDATVGSGVLSLKAGCSHLILENGEAVLLVWPEPTTWNAGERVIEVTDVFGDVLELRDGDRIMPGGAAATADTPFARAPDPSCEADETFVVATLQLLE